MQAPAPLGTTVVLSFANNGEDTKLDLKNSFWQQRIFDSDLPRYIKTCVHVVPGYLGTLKHVDLHVCSAAGTV